ncbi:hypothetical protein BGW80DRAFT_487310 [Lactifluus volemus]|nr:hypothetical protein BGW80DRAFT_487310 [Lactifluus volemus]
MFIRHSRLLRRFSQLPSLSHVITTPKPSSRTTIWSPQCLAIHNPIHLPSFPTNTPDRNFSPAVDIQPEDAEDCHSPDTNPQYVSQEAKEKDDSDMCALYARLNTPDYSRLATPLSPQQVRDTVLYARDAGQPFVLDNLARNILDSPQPGRVELATIILSIPRLRLNPSLTPSLVSCIVPHHLSSLSLNLSSYIARNLIHHPSPSTMETFFTPLAEHIAHLLKPVWKERQVNGRYIPTWLLFRFVMHLSKLHLREPAIRLLQSLIEAGYIPPEAIQRTDQSSRDFHLIITLTLVRSCIFWKWNHRAVDILKNYLSGTPSADPIISRLCQDVLYALMEFPTVNDLNLGVSFVKDMATIPEPMFISPDIVRQIYSKAHSLDQPHTAASIYDFARSKSIRPLHNFPPPSGGALTWLLRYLSCQRATLRLARRLVAQVVDLCEPIPLADRAEFIAIAAESGFARHARSLWEQYSSGRGGHLVAGNAAMVLRMCSLFANLRRRNATHKSMDLGIAEGTTATPIGHSHDSKDYDEEEKDLEDFANLILTRYRKVKEPLWQASREDLNALARANIILGHITEGLRVLRVVIDRNEYPDLHDINVLLSAIAKVDYRKALSMVRRMVRRGPEPDSISFGTVIHQAARHCDSAAISSLLQIARKTGCQLTTKTMVTVIRASVAFSGADKVAVRHNLIRALEIIFANEHSNHLATLNMGKFGVEEALNADDPTLAFWFWRGLLKSNVNWNDELHAALRGRIAGSIRQHHERGDIRAEDAQKMTYSLGANTRVLGGEKTVIGG